MFIFRSPSFRGSKVRHYTAEDFRVLRIEKTRTKSISRAGGMTFHEVEGTGKFVAGMVKVRPVDPLDAAGGHGTSVSYPTPTTAAGVKGILRRVRPEEEAKIAEVDAQIAALHEQLKEARRTRREAVAEAWTKAHVVRVAEVEERLS